MLRTEERTGPGLGRTASIELPAAQAPAVADAIARAFTPRTVLVLGCGSGALLGELWKRGIDARGLDTDPLAVARVPAALRDYVRLGGPLEPLGGPFDVAVCAHALDVVEPDRHADAVRALAECASAVVFAARLEGSERAARPALAWIEAFAREGLHPDPLTDATFLAPEAMVFRHDGAAPDRALATTYSRLVHERVRRAALETRVEEAVAARARAESARRELERRNAQLSARARDAERTANATTGALRSAIELVEDESDTAREAAFRTTVAVNDIVRGAFWRFKLALRGRRK